MYKIDAKSNRKSNGDVSATSIFAFLVAVHILRLYIWCTGWPYSYPSRRVPERGVVLLTWPIFVCATVDLDKILPPHAASWEWINKTDDGPPGCLPLLRRSMLLYSCDKLRHKLQVRFVTVFAAKFVVPTNRPSGVWALSFKYVVISEISRCL